MGAPIRAPDSFLIEELRNAIDHDSNAAQGSRDGSSNSREQMMRYLILLVIGLAIFFAYETSRNMDYAKTVVQSRSQAIAKAIGD
jgi:hypothetical protein